MRALLLVLLLAALPAAAAAPSPEAIARKEQGDARRDSGDATGALASYRDALQVSPDYVEALEEIGKLYFGAKKFREAAEAFERAVEIDGSYANNWFNLALASRRAGDQPRARDAFRRYLRIKPDDADARIRLADVLRAIGEREAAVKEYEAVLSAAESRAAAPALGDRAREALAQLRAEPAAAKPPPTITIVAVPSAPPAAPPSAPPAVTYPAAPQAPASPVVTPLPVQPVEPALPRPVPEPVAPPSPALLDKLALGDRLQQAGDHRGALFAFQDAVYLEPRHAVARVKLGRAYWVLRYVGQAEEQWQQASQLAPNDPSIAHMIEEARKAPRLAAAEPPAPPATPAQAAGPAGAASLPGSGTPRIYRLVPEGQGAQPAPATPLQPESPNVTTPGYGMPAPSQPGYAPPQYGAAPSYPAPQGGSPQAGYGGQAAYPQSPPAAVPQPLAPAPQYAPPAYSTQPAYAQPAPTAPPGYAPPGYPQPAAPPQPAYAQPVAPAQPYAQPAPVAPAQPSAAASAAAQRYRAALSLYIQRDYLGSIAELDAAITLDPSLAVAYTARGSSKFGLGKFREAAADYKAALDLDATRAEPIWGLAECQRMLKDPAAPDTYRRYAASVSGDVNEERRSKARRWATELSGQQR